MTDKQRRFVEEYLIDLNATRAYQAAYPSVKRAESAAACASKLLRNTKVNDYLQQRIKERQKRTEITQDKVLQELAAIAFADMTDIVSVEGGEVKIKDTREVPKETRKIIAGIKEGQSGVEVKMFDRLRALELLGKHLGMFDPRKDELDKQEQLARIEKLQAETKDSRNADGAEVTVRFVDIDGGEE